MRFKFKCNDCKEIDGVDVKPCYLYFDNEDEPDLPKYCVWEKIKCNWEKIKTRNKK